jgi:hypothetical protein
MRIRNFGLFSELNVSQVQPRGWLRTMLERQRDGLGRHHKASGFPYNTKLWAGRLDACHPHGQSWWPYEQAGYLVDGLLRLGYVTGADDLIALGRQNIDHVLKRPQRDGKLGPRHIGPSQWPHAVFFRALMAEYSVTRDPAIPRAFKRHFRALPDDFGHHRNVCLAEAMCWTYLATGDREALRRARRAYERFESDRPRVCHDNLVCDHAMDEHGVSFSEMTKIPVLLYICTGDRAYLEPVLHAYHKVDKHHVVASGLFSARERLAYRDGRELHETCCVSDYTWSLGYLLMATGQAVWADRLEKCIFNAGFGSITKDFRAHQYFSSPNQMIATSTSSWEGYHHASRCAYRPGHEVECCSGNLHRFLPNYTARMWMRSADGGLAATLYGPCEVSARVGRAPTAVRVVENTDYPFGDIVEFVVHATKDVRFPLHFRIPSWCEKAEISVNGRSWRPAGKPGTFARIERVFSNGDRIGLHLPSRLQLPSWPHKSVSIEKGPLVFSYAVPTRQQRSRVAPKQSKKLPAWELTPDGPWNYGLSVDEKNLQAAAHVTVSLLRNEPWSIDHSPIAMTVPARRVTNWKLPREGVVPDVPRKPEIAQRTERITLVPYGATTLRVTVFPQIPTG